MNQFLLGGIAIGSFVVGLFFLRFWRSSGDRFFLFLMLSFWIEAANRTDMVFSRTWNEDSPVHYSIWSYPGIPDSFTFCPALAEQAQLSAV